MVCEHDLSSKFPGFSNKRHWLCTMKDLTPILLTPILFIRFFLPRFSLPANNKNIAVYHCKGYDMKTFKTLAFAAAVSAGLLGAGEAMAFKDGELGPNSVGKFDVRLLVDQKARIWGFEDLLFSDPEGSEVKTQNVCLFSNSGRVSLQAGTINNFQLEDSAGATMDYILTVKGINADDGVISDTVGNNNGDNTISVTWGRGSQQNSNNGTHFLPFAANITDSNSCPGNENLEVKINTSTPSATFSEGTAFDTVTLTVVAQ